ncbi:MAG: ABC-F family ATP-binding cassette domain-containing protein [Ruminococcaceae bacterium]|nr:ABC-F family ATP-binding cassette domain-containing protein [Oscillospiraceae bacterium]
MYLSLKGASVAFAGQTLLYDIDFEIRNKEKVAVVGRNGCGKTTLLRLICGELESEGDAKVSVSGDTVVGYLKQISFDDLNISLEDELEKAFERILSIKAEMDSLSDLLNRGDSNAVERYSLLEELYKNLGGYYYQKEKETIIQKFGFNEERKRPLSSFSGGQLTKIAFMKLLLSKPDLLLLDEPTNHLDLETVEWLEGYIKNYPSAVIFVSHDQMFIDRISDVVYEIEYGRIKKYIGNYTEFLKKKEQEKEKQRKEYEQQQKEIEKTEKLIERFRYKATKAAMVQSRIKSLEKTELIAPPEESDTRSFFADFTPELMSGGNVLEVKNLKIGYSEVLSKVNFLIKRGQKLGVIGANGKGKSTLLKTVMGIIPPISGNIIQGINLRIGYFDQHLAQYVSDKTVLDDYWDTFPTLTQTEIRSDLGAFLFRGEDVFKQVNVLSGGEKVRLCLCKMLKKKPNFLILDEPTNHMDIVGKQALERMLKNYPGTLICVSHDRYFIKEVCDSLLVFGENETRHLKLGYDEYVETEKAKEQQATNIKSEEKDPVKKGKYYSAFKELSKINKKIEKTEETIAIAEEFLEGMKAELLSEEIASDYLKLGELQKEIEEKEIEISALYTEWEELNLKREEMNEAAQ